MEQTLRSRSCAKVRGGSVTKGVPMIAASLVQCLSLRAGLRRACSTGKLPCIACTDFAKSVTTCDNHSPRSMPRLEETDVVVHLFQGG